MAHTCGWAALEDGLPRVTELHKERASVSGADRATAGQSASGIYRRKSCLLACIPCCSWASSSRGGCSCGICSCDQRYGCSTASNGHCWFGTVKPAALFESSGSRSGRVDA
uniref:Uncharacterized protein n=1 Tax=Chlamydomonas euryale TaxID=1486919 RepID=A0A7R9VSI2_9CHLO|mmetsp:Transcript_43205/g.129661  ORF Transcript_43205/g.129661 Transcript_43205/m.129661 type:complete len:111 (+) Transcript_43205:187-519(+)